MNSKETNMPLSIPKTLCLCGALLMSMVSLSHAGWVIKDKLTAYPAIAKEKFGCSITTDGNWLAVGATDTAIVGFRSTGAVHLYERVGDQWNFRQTLFHPTPATFQAFGNSIALRENHLVIGSWGSNSFAGQVFVYTLAQSGKWTLAKTLEASDPQPTKPALFGWSVSLDMTASGSGVIAVGRVNDATSSTGAVYIFEGRDDTWVQINKLTVDDATKSDQLGTCVSVRNGTLVAGVARRRVAYIFTRAVVGTTPQWSQVAKLSPKSEAVGDNFGYSVASGGEFVAVGAPSRTGETDESRAGAVTIFYKSNNIWQEANTLLNLARRSEAASDTFGYSIAAAPLANSSQGIVAASAPSRDWPLSNSGSAFVFRGATNSWQMDDTDLWTSSALANQNIGKSLAMSADGSVVALATDGPTNSFGGAFPFMFQGSGGSAVAGGSTDDGSTGGGSTGGGSTGGGSTGGGSTGGGSTGGGSTGGGSTGGGSTGGPSDNPTGDFGSGGNVRPVNALLPLHNKLGIVSDTVFVNNSIGQSVYGMQISYNDTLDSSIRASTALLATYPDNLRLVSVADCNGDGGSDLLWQDRVTNEVILWTRDGTKILKKKVVISPAAGIKAVAAYDVQADGSAADIILLNSATSTVSVVNMYDGEVVNTVDLAMPNGAWRPVPFAFIKNSVLIRHSNTGELRRITMPESGAPSRTMRVDSPPAQYEIEAIGDIDNDGLPDIIARSTNEDQVRFYIMNGNNLSQVCTGLCTAHWNIQGMQDWDGNGVNDLLAIENGGDKRVVVLYMEVNSYASGSLSIPQIKSNQVLGRLGMGTVVGLGAR